MEDDKVVSQALDVLATRVSAYKEGQHGAREGLIAQARSVIAALETPIDSILWMIWAEVNKNLCARIAVDLKLFDTLSEEGGRPKTVAELAEVKKADPDLVRRILRQLAATNVIDEVDADVYAPTRLSTALTEPKFRDGIPGLWGLASESYFKLPEYLASIGYQNPTNGVNGPFQYAHGIDYHAFQWLSARPELMGQFHNYVMGYQTGRVMWFEMGFYPIKEHLDDGLKLDHDHDALVDVGGGQGHVMLGFKANYPSWRGRLIVQDMPDVLAQISKDTKDFEIMAHDFFTEQPVKGARAYYMHHILHDWPDERCLEILKHLKAAMEPGYSKILIDDMVIPDKGAHWKQTSLDLFMMALASAKERTESQWRTLLGQAGLKILKIWSRPGNDESIIEAVVE